MIQSILFGAGFAFAAAVQPGPLQAFLLTSVVQRGWRRTMPASFSPLVSDGPIALVTLFAMSYLPSSILAYLQAAGGALLLWIAWSTFRRWKLNADELQAQDQRGQRSLFEAAAVNLLNPNPYLGWMLVLGPAFLAAWYRSPAEGIALLVSFYGTMVAALAGTILLFGTTGLLTVGIRRKLQLASVALLAGIGIFQFCQALVHFSSNNL
jgi:threonine/homoserine/homoserine lactone efflux protein